MDDDNGDMLSETVQDLLSKVKQCYHDDDEDIGELDTKEKTLIWLYN